MSAAPASQTPELRRSLNLSGLVFMGLIMIQPTAPMPLFGVVFQEARGHVVTAILIAMVAMLFTAISYGRMARAYPSAGSAYTYVGREIHPLLGYAAGWSMLMDYVLNPVICTIWCAKAMGNILPGVPYAAWAVFFALLFTILNLRNIQATANTNRILTFLMLAVVGWMLAAAARWALNSPGIDLLRPFYDPETFSFARVSTGTSLAVLTYIGFDAISTLSEETIHPERNILRGTVITCLLIGVLSAVEVYAGQLVWPFGDAFPDVDTAFVHVAGRAGGPWLFHAVNLTLLVATIGSGSGALLAGARLMFAMGREHSLPRAFFGQLHPGSGVPANNVLLIGAIALAGAFTMTYQMGAELLNFGAFIGFMSVNLAAFLKYWLRERRRNLSHFLPPVAGFLVCGYLWLNLSLMARTAGALWLGTGLVYAIVRGRLNKVN
ncbi:MAG: APC family permease [Acidobacteria bacterium]|nr:APC family permease [Acidobacteriota bacterium]